MWRYVEHFCTGLVALGVIVVAAVFIARVRNRARAKQEWPKGKNDHDT